MFLLDGCLDPVTDPDATTNQINNDLHNSTWAHQCKINFNPDSSKQTQEVIFSHELKITAYLQPIFSINQVHETATQKHRFQAKFSFFNKK